MRHAVKDRLGYTGYACDKSAFLRDVHDVYRLVADENAERGLTSAGAQEFTLDTDGTYNYLDNFYNIPILYQGRVSVVEYLGGIHDPDAKSKGSDRRDVFSLATMTTMSGLIDMANKLVITHPSAEGTLGPGYIALADFTNAYKEPQIQVDIASNKYEDGNLIAQVQQEKRNKRVDEQLNMINWSTVNNVMVRMFETLHSMSLCPNFRISLTTGHLLHQVSNTEGTPKFTVGGGTVYVRDNGVGVSGLTDEITGSFDLGVKITLYDPSGEPYNYFQQYKAELIYGSYNSISESFSHSSSQTVIIRRLGGVFRAPFEFDGIQYYTYGIERTPCDVHIPPYYVAADGVLYAVAGGSTHYALTLYDCDDITNRGEIVPIT